VLAELAGQNAEEELGAAFETARAQELVHLETVQSWIAAAQKR